MSLVSVKCCHVEVCGRFLAGIVGSNAAGEMNVSCEC